MANWYDGFTEEQLVDMAYELIAELSEEQLLELREYLRSNDHHE